MAVNAKNVLVGYATMYLAPDSTPMVNDMLPVGTDWGVAPLNTLIANNGTTLTANAAAGALQVTIAGTATVGQTIVIDTGTSSEVRTVVTFTTSVVTFVGPLLLAHYVGAPVWVGAATAWKSPGATEGGVTLSVNAQTTDITVEEQAVPVMVLTTSKQVQISLGLSEDTVANMKYAYGGGNIVTNVPSTGIPGRTVLTLADTLDTLAVGLEGVNSLGMARRIYIPRMISAGQVQTVYRRAANNRSYSVTLRAICPASQVQIVDITASAL